MFRVLVAEDSVTARELLVAILRSDPEIAIVGEASNGLEAIALTKQLQPDVVTMDIRMPKLDGFESTRKIMIESPTPIVIVSGVYDEHDVKASMHALHAGALALLPKPPGPEAPDFARACERLIQTVKAMSQVKVVRRWPERPVITPAQIPVRNLGTRAEIVAIVASTGGPAALARILSNLPARFDAPILVVQHIAAGFVDGLAAWLNTISSLSVRVAREGDRLQPGTVYVGPDGYHLGVKDRTTIALSPGAPINGFRPSGTALFESIAEAFADSALAVILTGMGDDGVTGLRAVHRRGGRIIVQDQASSVVFGMPGAAVAAGLSDMTLPLDAIASRLEELAAR